MQLFNNIPPPMRKQFKQNLIFKGLSQVIIFPAAYFPKMKSFKDTEGDWQGAELLWVNCSTATNGVIAKSAPNFMIEQAIKVLKKYEQKFEIISLVEE